MTTGRRASYEDSVQYGSYRTTQVGTPNNHPADRIAQQRAFQSHGLDARTLVPRESTTTDQAADTELSILTSMIALVNALPTLTAKQRVIDYVKARVEFK